MRTIYSKDKSKRIDYHMTAGKGMKLNAKFGRNLFSIKSEEGLMQMAGLDPEGGYQLFLALTELTEDQIDDFEIDDIWAFLEGIFTDFFPSRVRETIPKLLEALKKQVLTSMAAQFETMDSPTAASSSVTGAAAL